MRTVNEALYRQVGLPVFQNKVYPDAALAKKAITGDVELVQCRDTGLVSNALFQPALLDYDQDYQNEQAWSDAFRTHLQAVLRIILAHTSPRDLGIEIGCGKGFFLELLNGAGANVVGYDPAYEGDNPRVVRQYFGAGKVESPPDYLILRHVLEHITAPWPFLEDLAGKCGADTKIYIEVPCFEWIVESNAFYDVFYEHVNYFTLDVLTNAFGRVIECGKLFGGQYLYIVADLASFHSPNHYSGTVFAPLMIDAYLESLLANRNGHGQSIYVWGAGAKGITFSNILSRSGVAVSALVDINPAKQGRFAGLSGIPILAPSEALPRLGGSDVFVMNPVYLNEIKAMSGRERINWISVAA